MVAARIKEPVERMSKSHKNTKLLPDMSQENFHNESPEMERSRPSSPSVEEYAEPSPPPTNTGRRRKNQRGGGPTQNLLGGNPLGDPSQLVNQTVGQVGQTAGQVGQTVGGLGRAVGGAVGGGGKKSDTLKLRLDLNLDVDVQIRARVHGDVTLSLL